MTVDLKVEDDIVTDYGQDVKACALGQAAAAVIGAAIVGQPISVIENGREELFAMLKNDGPVHAMPFDGLEVLAPAKDYMNC